MSRLPLKILHGYVLLSLLAFVTVQFLKFNSFSNPRWIFQHLNDFLTIPIVATICLHVIWAIQKDRTIRLSIITIFSLVVLFSLYFEYYLPRQSHRYTADTWDIFCYFLGGIVFYFFQRIKLEKEKKDAVFV
jgi:di/tricarboxylate transporter